MQHNIRIRETLKSNGLHLYQLGEMLSVSEAYITRMMRHELPKEKQSEIISLIEKEVKNGSR